MGNLHMITSRKNSKIQEIRNLIAKKSLRDENGLCVLEGTRLLAEAMQAAWQPKFGFYCASQQERISEMVQQLTEMGAEMEEVPLDLLSYVADTTNPQSLVVVFEQHSLPLPARPDFVLILDAIRDPGNLGTTLRTAAAAGVNLVILTEDCADPFSPKVLRSGMGAQFHLPILSQSIPEIKAYCEIHKIQIFIADSNGGESCWKQNYRSPLAMVIGNEANGPSAEFQSPQTQNSLIPMPGGFESLNAAVAAGVLLFEVVRQRQA
jgi:TrmH family RNA methyltransferase